MPSPTRTRASLLAVGAAAAALLAGSPTYAIAGDLGRGTTVVEPGTGTNPNPLPESACGPDRSGQPRHPHRAGVERDHRVQQPHDRVPQVAQQEVEVVDEGRGTRHRW